MGEKGGWLARASVELIEESGALGVDGILEDSFEKRGEGSFQVEVFFRELKVEVGTVLFGRCGQGRSLSLQLSCSGKDRFDEFFHELRCEALRVSGIPCWELLCIQQRIRCLETSRK